MKTVDQLFKTKRAVATAMGGKNKVRKFKLKRDFEDGYKLNYRKNVYKSFELEV